MTSYCASLCFVLAIMYYHRVFSLYCFPTLEMLAASFKRREKKSHYFSISFHTDTDYNDSVSHVCDDEESDKINFIDIFVLDSMQSVS